VRWSRAIMALVSGFKSCPVAPIEQVSIDWFRTKPSGAPRSFNCVRPEVTTTDNGADPGPEVSSHRDQTTNQAAPETNSAQVDSGRTSTPKRSRGRRRSRAKPSRRSKTSTAATARAAKFPRHTVERALRIPQAIYDQNGGRPATLQEAVAFTGGAAVSGPFRTEVSSAKKYGFLEPFPGGKIGLTARAR